MALFLKGLPAKTKKTVAHTHLIYKSSFPIACSRGFPCCYFVFFSDEANALCILVLQMKYVFGNVLTTKLTHYTINIYH